MNRYLFTARSNLHGPVVHTFHKITEDAQENAAVIFGMSMASKVNMGTGLCMVTSDDACEWTGNLLQKHLRSLSQKDFSKFINDSLIDQGFHR